MKGITGYVFGAVALMLLGVVCLTVSRIERQVADAQQSVATLQYDGVEEALDNVERYLEYGSRLPWVGNGPLNRVRARRAALHYWQRQYGSIVPQEGDPVGVVAADNIELQLVVANAVYRTGQAKATDRATYLEAVKTGIGAYLTVLRNATRHETAAYNYEYLVRLRDDIEKRRVTPDLSEDGKEDPFGEEGGPPQEGPLRQFKVLVPLDTDDTGDPGKGEVIQRKG